MFFNCGRHSGWRPFSTQTGLWSKPGVSLGHSFWKATMLIDSSIESIPFICFIIFKIMHHNHSDFTSFFKEILGFYTYTVPSFWQVAHAETTGVEMSGADKQNIGGHCFPFTKGSTTASSEKSQLHESAMAKWSTCYFKTAYWSIQMEGYEMGPWGCCNRESVVIIRQF